MNQLREPLRRIVEARHHDPFDILGRHKENDQCVIRIFQPGASHSSVLSVQGAQPMTRIPNTDLFEWRGSDEDIEPHYRISWQDCDQQTHEHHDPYSFLPIISDFDLYLFGEGKHHHAHQFLGAHPQTIDGIEGVLFATWAPNAERISVVGEFNRWDGRCHPMRSRGGNGIWELFIPGIDEGALYKFEIRDHQGHIHLKVDPYGRRFEMRPANSSIVESSTYAWRDGDWLKARAELDWLHAPMSVYEVHLGSWQKDEDYKFISYRELADQLVNYVARNKFTHIELLPVTEHPFDGSWGYQTTGYFAPTSRFGSPDDFRYFVDQCHQAGIGVILDWVPAHFPKDSYALARFDGTALYEHEDPRKGEHRDWGTLIFNFGRNEVRNFLISSALFWLDEMHIDGLRVDAVASMLYLDYSRSHDDWIPNMFGGNENLEAIDFLRELNVLVHEKYPGALTMAEESTSWPMVSRPTDVGGLGFSMKWNMGWMNDTLDYMHHDPIHRKYHHNQLTFGMMYAFSENFVLPFSHDEVVHLKRSMLDKMPGDDWQRFANLRLLYTYMFTMPGKKLLFMGNEFAQGREWDYDKPLEWFLLGYHRHQGIQRLVADLNGIYRTQGALHRYEFEPQGFAWLDCDDAQHSMLSYRRMADGENLVIALNFTPVMHEHYRIGVAQPGRYEVLLNSDSEHYGGSNKGNIGEIIADDKPWNGQPYSVGIIMPALAGIVLHRVGDA